MALIEKGFEKTASKTPFLKSQEVPEIAIIGVDRFSELRICRATPMPPSFGIALSVITKSKLPLSNFFIPSKPSAAVTTLKPNFVSADASISVIASLSSITKMFGIIIDNLVKNQKKIIYERFKF